MGRPRDDLRLGFLCRALRFGGGSLETEVMAERMSGVGDAMQRRGRRRIIGQWFNAAAADGARNRG
jgi:hypothetical protein